MRILFVTSNRLGDAVLSTGLLDHLLHAHPTARVTVVCGAVAEGVFARMPRRERTIVLEKRPYGLHWLPLWAATVPHWWDLVVDIRGSALSFLVPTRRRAVKRRADGHKTAQLASLLDLHPPPLPVVWTAPADLARAAALLPTGRPLIALAPTANWAPKTWPADRFAALFHAVQRAMPDAIPLVLGGPGPTERAMAAPLLAALPTAIDLVGGLTVPEAAACLARAALFVGNDSGLMHVAAASGAPTIGLFGPTNAAEYGPAGRCMVAVRSPDGEMTGITVEAVRDAARALTPALPWRDAA
ncbi:MAG: glycosyltransferase family 9 protein [Rhodospirillales bacterium]|nr:glycosyltransferase family 9 protein [Rhodospirillales bacterium]